MAEEETGFRPETLEHMISRGAFSLRDLARELDMSERSLQRHLASKGSSYSSELDHVRTRIACLLLRRSGASIAVIGQYLGFKNAGHFSRAFRRWTGKTPKDYRLKCDRKLLQKGRAVSEDVPNPKTVRKG